jgi:hypothetical protein
MNTFKRFHPSAIVLGLAAAGLTALPASADERDFGQRVEHQLGAQSEKWFGINQPIEASAPPTTGAVRQPGQRAEQHVVLAGGLKVEYLTRDAANATDMMAFWPAQHPTHLITCVEGGRRANINAVAGKFNPSVQRIRLSDGSVETILRGLSACDGIRTTPWGTVLATEETSDGGAYEIIDPLNTTGNTVTDRATGSIAGPTAANIVKRTALPRMAWEGIAILDNGVLFAGDELRPGSPANADGGAIFKFVPAAPFGGPGPITDLNLSPFAAGKVYAMQVSCLENVQQFGQGCEIGNGAWVEVTAANARADANAGGATGYYRPEDLHQDPMFADAANPDAVRFCWTNTGRKEASNYAEVVCAVDRAPLTASATERTVVANRFVEGDADFNSFDNLEFQPVTGNLYVIEDDDNGDIFACLPDGADRDIKSDGCVKLLSVVDSSAEPTGFIFTADGTAAYLSIQHSNDALMPLVDDYPTDDVLKISGFKVKGR